MPGEMSRRDALRITCSGLAAILTLTLPEPIVCAQQFSPQQKLYQTNFTLLGQRRIRKAGHLVMESSFCLDSNFWRSLNPGLSKSQLFGRIQDATMLVALEVLYQNRRGLKKHVNNRDFYHRFVDASDTTAEKFPRYFTTDRKGIFDNLIKRELHPEDKMDYPKGSKIYLQVGRLSSIDIWIKRQEDMVHLTPSVITDPRETNALRTFYLLTLLTEDDEIPGYDRTTIKCPLDKIYSIYTSSTKK
ncbi:MAG: hypothetical protein PHF67_04010 [Candidatus Nanoarchaeia archaeon]|nr:hypothetical protein [Candidatus Nanoarchaeia archaeon]